MIESTIPAPTAKAIDEISSAVIRDYVQRWYSPLLPGEDKFPSSCQEVLSNTLQRIYSYLSQKRAQDTFMTFLLSTSNILIIFFRELSTALRTNSGSAPRVSIASYVEEYPSSALAQLLDQDLQKRKSWLASEDILQSFLERRLMKCHPVRIFLHEVLAGVIFPMMIDKCSEADWINSLIISFLDEELHETDSEQPGESSQGYESEKLSSQDRGGSEDEKMRTRLSKAEAAMQEAIREAQELSRVINEEQRQENHEGSRADNEPISPTSLPPGTGGDAIFGMAKQLKSPENSTTVTSPSRPEVVKSSFTDFDQIIAPPLSLISDPKESLHDAIVTIMDLSPSMDQSYPPDRPLQSMPASEYLIQIEPSASYSIPGWMVTRRYTDFVPLHEILVKLSIISGVKQFLLDYPDVPSWKGATSDQLRERLEIYLNGALHEKTLAQSEGMQKFLEKGDCWTAIPNLPASKPFSNLAKGWVNPKYFTKVGGNAPEALTKGPQEAVQGRKTFFEGVFSGVGAIRRSSLTTYTKLTQPEEREDRRKLPMGVYNPPRAAGEKGNVAVVHDSLVVHGSHVKEPGTNGIGRSRVGSLRNGYIDGVTETDDWIPRVYPDILEAHSEVNGANAQSIDNASNRGIFGTWRSQSPWKSQAHKTSKSVDYTSESKNERTESLPPPPMDIQDDFLYPSPTSTEVPSLPPRPDQIAALITETSCAPGGGNTTCIQEERESGSDISSSQSSEETSHKAMASISSPLQSAIRPEAEIMTCARPKPSPPLSEQDAQFIMEIVFAILSELFTLSSAWLLRRSLLNVAKNIMLRPGNNTLDTARLLIQETIFDRNTTDEAISKHINRFREMLFPTKDELQAWEKMAEENRTTRAKRKGVDLNGIGVGKKGEYEGEEGKEERREKARRLLLEKGMPGVLEGVMGQKACRECLGNVFDCLQEKNIARGVMCGLLLGAVRGVCQ